MSRKKIANSKIFQMPLSRFDNNNLLEHYKRIYNAKPSPEIAKTRSSNIKRRIISNGQVRPSAQLQSTYSNSSNWQQAWKNPEENYYRHSFDDLSNHRLLLQNKSIVKSRNNPDFNLLYHDTANLENRFGGRFLNHRASLREIDSDFSNPSNANIKPRRPASAALVPQNQASRKQLQVLNSRPSKRMLNEGQKLQQRSIDARKYMSMQNLNDNIENGTNVYQPRQFLSQTSLDQLGMRPATSLSDRIDSFLQVLRFEQEEQQMARSSKHKYFSGLRPSISSNQSFAQGNISSRKTSALSVSSFASKSNLMGRTSLPEKAPAKLQRTVVRRVTSVKRPMTAPATTKSIPLNPTRVTSKLAQDRNYQPPRARKQSSSRVQNKTSSKAKSTPKYPQKSVADDEVYEDDFEPNEEDEEGDGENSDNAIMRQKQEWLYDQFQRVRARQRAALIIKRQENGVEKASSKDSAYGYSGGETSRMHTREPTPDNHNNVNGGFPRGFSRYASRSKHMMNKLNGSIPSQRTNQPPPLAKPRQEAKHVRINTTYLKVVSEVTNEILKSSSFTEHSVKRILYNHLSNSKEKHNLTKSEVEDLFMTLKCELGLESSKTQKGIQDLLMPDGRPSSSKPVLATTSTKTDTMSSSRLRKKIYNRGQSSSDSNHSNNILPSKQEPRRQDHHVKISVSEPFDESEILKMLREEMDMDDSMVEDILKASFSTQHRQRPASAQLGMAEGPKSGMFKNLNISNLDVSFNASVKGLLNNVRRREELNQEKAKLIKSFALQGKERSIRTKYEESCPEPVPTSKPKELKVQETIKSVEKDMNDNTPRSSMLYQTDEESKEMSEAIPDDDPDSDTLEDESVEEEDHLKNI